MTLKEMGKRIPTLSEYLSMVLPIKGSHDDETVNQVGMETTGRKDEFFLVQTSQTQYRMMPGPEFTPRFYRGQNKQYPECKPQVFRNINKTNRRQKYCDGLYWTAKQYELTYLVFHHPAVQEMLHWSAEGLSFNFDIRGIAQHYQYQTQFLDVTRHKDIAMFFATHNLVGKDLNPEPAIGNEAVLYTMDARSLWDNQESAGVDLLALGIDPLPRSAAQGAFALELGLNSDLEQIPGVSTETFLVTEELANSALEKVGGVNEVFPYDPFEPVISKLRDSGTVCYQAIELTVRAQATPPGMTAPEVAEVIKEGGYQVTFSDPDLPSNTILKAAEKEWETRKKYYLDRIRLRAVSDHYNGNPT